jgi:hypothetical protein
MARDYPFPRCPTYVSPIRNTERIGNSLVKINNNFANLRFGYCRLKERIEKLVFVRTFFYYGPNASTDPESGMNNNTASYPSNNRILDFINNPLQLNVPAISKNNDIAYVIYQKTGYYSRNATKRFSGSITVNTGSNIPTEVTKVVNYTDLDSEQGPAFDSYNVFSPVFIIWKLTMRNNSYTIDSGFPKFTQAETIASVNWDKPQLWNTY